VQLFIDGCPRLKYIYFLKKMSDAGGVQRDFIVKYERKHDCLFKSVHAYNAAEFTVGDFNSCLCEQGIKFTSSAPYSPESNGLAEKFNKILFARVRCLLDHSGMDKVLWGTKLPTTPCTYSTSRRQDLLAPSLRMKLRMALCLMSESFACLAVSPFPPSHIQEAQRQGSSRYQHGSHWLRKVSSAAAGTRLHDISRDLCEVDEQVLDFAADAVKEVTGIRNITGGEEIISHDKRLLVDDDEDEDEHAKGSKAAPPIAAQNSDNHDGDVKGQEVKEVKENRR
jgi:hypothetical protein